MSPGAARQYLLREKRAHPNRQLGRGFPYLDTAELPLVTGDDREGLSLGYYPSHHREAGPESDAETEEGDSLQLISRRLWAYLLQRAGLSAETKWSQVEPQDVDRMVKEVTACELEVAGKLLSAIHTVFNCYLSNN